jgi:hypothetical protein
VIPLDNVATYVKLPHVPTLSVKALKYTVIAEDTPIVKVYVERLDGEITVVAHLSIKVILNVIDFEP